jgi:inorganic phosphate transporter, PiT family
MPALLIFLTSGLFLGWSLGANDAANVWGTAVGTRMVKFRKAAILCSVFVIIGAVFSGSGASNTLGRLGTISEMAGAFTVALAAAISVYVMTKAALPVSTSQSIVGAIIGWSFFSKSAVDYDALIRIVGTWVFSPVLSALVAILLFYLVSFILKHVKIHLIRLDSITRTALILAGIFGSYSLGANNIANVMGVFTISAEKVLSPIPLVFAGEFTVVQQLFLLGGLAIALGVFSYSKRVMMTVGTGIYRLSPITAFIVVLSSAIVLFLFASAGLKEFLETRNLPSFPLVPVSSSQSIVGAVIGVGIAKGGKNINYRILGRISIGWLATPLIAAGFSYIMLFVVQNVFLQKIF